MHINQLLLGRKGPRLVKPTRRGILLLFSAQKQKHESSRLLSLKQTKGFRNHMTFQHSLHGVFPRGSHQVIHFEHKSRRLSS